LSAPTFAFWTKFFWKSRSFPDNCLTAKNSSGGALLFPCHDTARLVYGTLSVLRWWCAAHRVVFRWSWDHSANRRPAWTSPYVTILCTSYIQRLLLSLDNTQLLKLLRITLRGPSQKFPASTY